MEERNAAETILYSRTFLCLAVGMVLYGLRAAVDTELKHSILSFVLKKVKSRANLMLLVFVFRVMFLFVCTKVRNAENSEVRIFELIFNS